ncbi:hypothetical protein BB560_005369 [Smittium megazygosporum]|uniref:Queuosine 5'-phosphate N-glycosylase/hydrolase n=1 Tax=Smittium megazygosporum TaxID=133381 RepID=A0A2T9Z6N0_9FUNG|nr:hypothetical protein BB560_005369 [Smittium megazygosporum]
MGIYRKAYDETLELPQSSEDYLETVFQSCLEFVNDHSQNVKIDKSKITFESVRAFIEMIEKQESKKLWCERLPLKFPNYMTEMNFIVFVELVSCIFHKELIIKCTNSQGDDETVKFNEINIDEKRISSVVLSGAMSLYLSQNDFTLSSLGDLSVSDISSHFQIPLMGKEKPVLNKDSEFSGIMLSEPSEYQAISKMIHECIESSIYPLKSHGVQDFASLIIKAIELDKPNLGQATKPSSTKLIKVLVNAIPCFRDGFEYTSGDVKKRVYFFSGAQILCYTLYKKYSNIMPHLFDFTDFSKLNFACSSYDLADTQSSQFFSLAHKYNQDKYTYLQPLDYALAMAFIVVYSSTFLESINAFKSKTEVKELDNSSLSYFNIESFVFKPQNHSL